MQFQDQLLHGHKKVADVLLEINREQSTQFIDAKLARQKYRNTNPTEIIWLKCMDGRLNGPVFTNTPLGIITPFRSAGARFDLGWPYFMDKVSDVVNYAIGKGRDCVFFCTYHYSHGSAKRGCKAFNFDTDAARASAIALKKQFDEAFAGTDRVVHSIVVGLETDEHSLVLHGTHGGNAVLRLADLQSDIRDDELRLLVEDLCPELPVQIVHDLLPLLRGNLVHIAEMRVMGREPEELDHREVGVFLGRGFSWLHTPNRAIIIGPWEQWKDELVVGGHILLDNLQKERVPKGTKPVFMVSAPYREPGSTEYRLASFKARYLFRDGLGVLKKEVPQLVPHLDFLVGTVNMEDLLFTQIQI